MVTSVAGAAAALAVATPKTLLSVEVSSLTLELALLEQLLALVDAGAEEDDWPKPMVVTPAALLLLLLPLPLLIYA